MINTNKGYKKRKKKKKRLLHERHPNLPIIEHIGICSQLNIAIPIVYLQFVKNICLL